MPGKGKAGADNIKARRYTVYRNGDPLFKPIQWTYSNRYYRTFEKLCEDLEEKVPPRKNRYGQGGIGIKVLYSEDGRTKIRTLEELEKYQGDHLVIAGPEPYQSIKGGYKSIPPRTPKEREEKGKPKPREESYREKNKKRYGDVERSQDQKIHNRTDPGTTKRFTVYKNGDEKFKPKLYIWRSKQTPTWEKLLEDLGRIAPTSHGGRVQRLFTLDGNREVDDFDDIEEGGHYVVAGGEDFEQVIGGYDGSGDGEGGNGERGGEGDPDKRDEEFWEKDAEMQRKHREKMAGQRKEEEKVYNRKDQIYPEPIFLLLVTMDGHPVPTVGHLVNRGSYVVVPLGEKFRDTWYYLPEGSLDTSADADEEENERQTRYNSRSPNPNRERSPNPSRDQRNNRYRSRSQDSRTESGREDYDEYNTAYDRGYESRDEDYQEDYGNSRGRSRNSRRSRTPRGQHNHRGSSVESDCSYCRQLEEHRRRHEKEHHTPRGSRANSRSPSQRGRERNSRSPSEDRMRERSRNQSRDQRASPQTEKYSRNQRDRNNSRSISPEKRRSQTRGNTGVSNRSNSSNVRGGNSRLSDRSTRDQRDRRNSRSISPPKRRGQTRENTGVSKRSNSSDVRGGNNRLSVNYHQSSGSRRGSTSSKGSTLKRSNSDASMFYAKNQQSRNSSRRPSTVNYDKDSGMRYRASSGRAETKGARQVRDTRETRTEVPLEHRRFRFKQIPEARSAASSRTTKSNKSDGRTAASVRSDKSRQSMVSNYRR